MPSQLLDPAFLIDAAGTPLEGPVLIREGRVVAIGTDAVGRAPDDVIRVPLPHRMLSLGFVNAHSHAVQRALRGRVEGRDRNAPHDSFWSWREQMYADANRFSLDDIEAIATWCFADLLRAGFVAVGEFHYLHHALAGARHPDDATAASQRIARAAKRVGIRLALLTCAYERAGPSLPPSPGQARFVFGGVDEFLAFANAVERNIEGPRVHHGLAIHSVRACSRGWIEQIGDSIRERPRPLHVHACEQRRELEICHEEHGVGPIELLRASGALSAHTAIVHATHVTQNAIEQLQEAQAQVVLCPSTERNLGDGLCPIADLVDAGISISIGTDSHARIDVADELRSLEDHERLRTERRCVLVPPGGSFSQGVFAAGTQGGARAIGLSPATFAEGARADFVAIEIPLEGRGSDDALGAAQIAIDAWLVGGSSYGVTDVFVAGERVVCNRHLAHASTAEIEHHALEVLRRA